MRKNSDEQKIRLYTIGFAGHSAREFFGLLRDEGIERVVDIRLRNTNQIAGFSKKGDLEFFLKELLNCEYVHLPLLAPTDQILDDHRKGGPWSEYVQRFAPLMRQRKILDKLDIDSFREKSSCLLCSERTPDECHRRLIAEMMQQKWPMIEIVHLIDKGNKIVQ